ncbi:hypothetical protein HYV64_02900 [Candidatus Shapirobacteria bacterium]|nr:hypothetical protein [Candidatus Shapirobacteria bacterium]
MSGVVGLAMASVFPDIDKDIFNWSLVLLWLILWRVLRKCGIDKYKRIRLIDLWWTVPLWIVLLSRFPIYYPVYDDFAFHLEVGGYAKNLWQATNFLPLDYGSYVYPVAQLIYPFLLNILGFRLSLLVNGILLIGWYISINLRLKHVEKNKNKKIAWDLIFLYVFFVPHLMATHTTFMVDFLTLVLGVEMFYQLATNKGNRTLGVIVGLLSMIIKQSAGIVLMPLFLYLVWQKKKDIKWIWVFLFLIPIFIFFGASYINTGNPISFLYNGFFKSPLYSLTSFKDARWGPQNWWEVLLWPIVGQFTLRYGEGLVNDNAKYFFASFWAVPYLWSWWMLLVKRKWKYAIFVFSYLLWSVLMGYSRYLLTFVAVYWLYLINELKVKYDFKFKKYWWWLLIFVGLCFNSVSTDFGWRPDLQWLKSSADRPYFIKHYVDGWRLIGKDRLEDIENSYKSILDKKRTVIIAYRGQESFLAYLASVNGASVVQAVDTAKYNELTNSNQISDDFKSLLKKVDEESEILVIGNTQWLNLKSIYWTKNRNCDQVKINPAAWYFQSPTLYADTVLYLCIK